MFARLPPPSRSGPEYATGVTIPCRGLGVDPFSIQVSYLLARSPTLASVRESEVERKLQVLVVDEVPVLEQERVGTP